MHDTTEIHVRFDLLARREEDRDLYTLREVTDRKATASTVKRSEPAKADAKAIEAAAERMRERDAEMAELHRVQAALDAKAQMAELARVQEALDAKHAARVIAEQEAAREKAEADASIAAVRIALQGRPDTRRPEEIARERADRDQVKRWRGGR